MGETGMEKISEKTATNENTEFMTWWALVTFFLNWERLPPVLFRDAHTFYDDGVSPSWVVALVKSEQSKAA